MLRSTIFLALLLTIGFTAQAQQPQKQPNYKKTGAAMPPFVIKKLNGSTFSNAQLKKGVPTVFFIFSPTCDHCEKMMDTLKSREAEFKNAQFVFVAEERQLPHVNAFITKTGIQKLPFFKNLGTDTSNLIYYIYGYQALPQVNIYNTRGKLAHTFYTNIPLDSVKLFLK